MSSPGMNGGRCVPATVSMMLAAAAFAARPAEIRIVPGADSLIRARDEVREMIRSNGGRPPEGGIDVVLDDGEYLIDEPLSLSVEDSGTAGARITYRAAHRGKAVISGRVLAKEVSVDWSAVPARLVPEPSRPFVRCWELPGAGALPGFYNGGCCSRKKLHDDSVGVFSGGERCEVARWPNGAYARTGKPQGVSEGATNSSGKSPPRTRIGTFLVANAPLEAWRKEPDLWAFGKYGKEWSDISSPVVGVDVQAGTISVESSKNPYGFRERMPFFVFNSFSDLDRAGEWALDRGRRRVYVWGRDPSPPSIAGARSLLVASGLSHVTFEGLAFEMARGDALVFDDADSVRVIASCVRHVNGSAIDFTASRNCMVRGCDIYDVGLRGVSLEGGERMSLTPGSNVVDNCHIHHFGRVSPSYHPGVRLRGCGNRAVRNLIHHSLHQAVTFNGNDHYIGFNICHDCCTFTDDAGTIYSCARDWTMRGNVVEYNVIHMTGKQPRTKHVRAIYLDDWTSGTLIRGNIINRAPQGIYCGGGNGNVFVQNVIFNTPEAICIGSRGLDSFAKETTRQGAKSWIYRKFIESRNLWDTPLWRTRYPELKTLAELPDPVDAHNAHFNVVSSNLLVATGGITSNNWDAIAATTTMSNNLETSRDPGFVDYAGFDWELCADSPARRALGGGTRFGEMGLYDGAARFSPAVRHGADMTPPRPLGVEKLSAQVIVLVTKRLALFNGGEAAPSWRDYSFSFVPNCDAEAKLHLYGKANWEETEYDDIRVEGGVLEGTGKSRRLSVRKGVEVKVSFRARQKNPL